MNTTAPSLDALLLDEADEADALALDVIPGEQPAAEELPDGLEMYTLDFRETPFWPHIVNGSMELPDAGRIKHYLERRGVLFEEDGFINVRTNGEVNVYAYSDPTAVWPEYDNAELPAVSMHRTRLTQLMAIRQKMIDGTVTAEDRNRALRFLITAYLIERGAIADSAES